MTDFMCQCLEKWSEGGTYPKWIMLHAINKKGSIYLFCPHHGAGGWFN